MKTKQYLFTLDEILALRDAMVEYKHFIKPESDASENRIKRFKLVEALAEQFKNDARLVN